MPTSLLKTLFWGLGKGKSGRTPTKRPSKMALFELMLFWLKWREKGPKAVPSPFKVALCKLRYKNHHFTLLTPCFWTPIFDLLDKMLIYSALIEGPQNRAQKP